MIPVNPQLIVLEGADGVGKSTLGRELAKHFEGFYFHATATKSLIPAMADYQQNLMDNIKVNVEDGRTVVMDRFWPSELIYGSVFRPNNPHGFTHNYLKAECEKLNAIYIICVSRTAKDRHRRMKDPDHPYDDSDYNRVYDKYMDFWMSHQGDPHFMIYELETWKDQMRDFAKIIKIRYNDIRSSKFSLGKDTPLRSQ